MSRRVYSNPATDALITAFAPYVVGAIALWILFKRGESKLPAEIEKVKTAAREIKAGLPGYVADKVMGRSEATYITFAEQQRRAAAILAAKKANAEVAGFAPVVYGA